MRYRVDFKYGYASFDEKDYDKVQELIESGQAIRVREQDDIFDEGRTVWGPPVYEDISGGLQN